MENCGARTISINDADFFGTPERPKEVIRALKGRGIQWQATNENLRTSPAVSVIRTKNLQRQGLVGAEGGFEPPEPPGLTGGDVSLLSIVGRPRCRIPRLPSPRGPATESLRTSMCILVEDRHRMTF
jgi:hypothetical protein